jgi:tetratricopeptide (TPR) repeat protein
MVMFVCSLLSKPMAVTLPVVLLILDVYPFGRTNVRGLFTSQRRVLVEKVPFFVLSIVSSILTVQAQGAGGSIVPAWVHPIGDRVLIAVKGLCYYLLKMVWPSDLVPLYPFPIQISLDFEYIASLIVVIGITIISLWLWLRNQRIFLTVWLTYIVMMFPVIGIFQTGGHAVANRYTYLPLLGPLLLLWMGGERMWKKADTIWHGNIFQKLFFSSLVLAVMIILSFLTIGQEKVWKDSRSLWSEEILHFPLLHIAYDNRADAYIREKDYQKATEDLKRSLTINPQYPMTYYRLGLVFEKTGAYIKALQNHSKALELFPGFEPAWQGKERSYQKALEDLNRDIHENSLNIIPYINRGNIHALMERYDKALEDFNRVLEIDPSIPTIYYNRGLVYFNMGQHHQAVDDFTAFLEHDPKDAQTYYHRGLAYEKLQNKQQSVRDFQNAARMGDTRAQEYLQAQGITW